MSTPAHQMPTIKEGSTIGFRFSIGTWCAIIGFIGSAIAVVIGFAIWLHTVYSNQIRMEERQEKQDAALERIERAVQEIEFRQKYGVFSSVPKPTTAAP